MTRLASLSTTRPPGLVTLARSPLRRVLCVLQFAPILRISEPTGQGIAAFQDLIRATYPIFRSEQLHELRFEANEAGQIVDSPTIITHPSWAFEDLEQQWLVTLTQRSIAIQVDGDGYDGRDDLISRFLQVVAALNEAYAKVVFSRLGFRYVNLFQGDMITSIGEYVTAEMLGYGRQLFSEGFKSSFTQTEGVIGSSSLLIKSGFLPAGGVGELFPAPLSEDGWMLDIDASQILGGDRSEEDLQDVAIEITSLNCDIFRWSVTDRFIREYRRG